MKTIYGKKCLFDTNILIAGRIENHSFHTQAKEIFSDLRENRFTAFISVQNIMEYSSVLMKGYGLSHREMRKNITDLILLPGIGVIYPSPMSTDLYLEMIEKYSMMFVYDLYLLATAISNGVEVIISADRDFSKVKEIEFYNPFRSSKN